MMNFSSCNISPPPPATLAGFSSVLPSALLPSFDATITKALGQNASIYGKMAVIDFRFRVFRYISLYEGFEGWWMGGWVDRWLGGISDVRALDEMISPFGLLFYFVARSHSRSHTRWLFIFMYLTFHVMRSKCHQNMHTLSCIGR